MSKPATSKTPLTCQNCAMWAGVLGMGTCMWPGSAVYKKRTWNWEKTPCVSPREESKLNPKE